MASVCMYFQVHQPNRLKKYTIFDIGNNSNYFDEYKNEQIILRVAEKCYNPTNEILLELIKKHHGKFKVAFSITGTLIEQLMEFSPKTIEGFKKLAETGCVEFLSETYYHSLSYIYSKEEFYEQVKKHKKMILDLFNQEPKIFRFTELVYNNDLASDVEALGYGGILAEGADHILGWRNPNKLYKAKDSNIKVLLKNYRLSDDIAFRFSNVEWSEYPLTAQKYSEWITKHKADEVIGLFMDYETFGEHQWKETKIFEFLEELPDEILKENHFVLPSEVLKEFVATDEFDSPDFISWADYERDLSAWLGNKMQKEAIKELYMLREAVLKTGDEKLISDWRMLQTSDHFYYMCTKFFEDGNVHKYFNPYDSPYEGFIAFINILNDIILRVKKHEEKAYVGDGANLSKE